MTLRQGADKQGPYYKWGSKGIKFYYETGNLASRKVAQRKAMRDRDRIEYFKNKENSNG